jgi:TonB family protein
MSGLLQTGWFFFLFTAALKSTAVLGAAWLLAVLLRNRSAALRHLVWTSAVTAVLALPFLSISLPALRVPATALLPASNSVVFHATGSEHPGANTAASVGQASVVVPSQPAPWRPDWRMWLMTVWAAGTVAMLGQMLAACVMVCYARRSAKTWSGQTLARELSDTLGIHQPVEVLESKAGSMPMAFGFLRSTIFMPVDAAEWTQERRRVVLLHELAHVRRGDFVTHLLARTALALHWWNPLAWTAWREFLKESERATDDLVLNAGTLATEYAGHLVEVARNMQSPAMEWAAVAMVRRSQLESRVQAILDSRVNRQTQGRASALIAVLAAVGMVAPLAAVRAQERATTQTGALDVEAAVRSARSQNNYEMLERAAEAAEQLREFEAAQKLLQSAVTIRADVTGKQSLEYGMGVLKLGDFESRRHRTKAAAELYAQAAGILGNRPESAPALIHLGTTAIVQKDIPSAIEYFERAQRIDPAQSGRAVMWMAVARQSEGNLDEAGTLYQSALSAQDPSSPEAVVTMKSYAQFLQRLGRTEEATQMEARANAAQKVISTQAQPKSSLAAGVYRIGGDVSPPSLLQKVEPEYSDEARAAKLTGTVALSIEIGPDGLARNARVLRELGLGLDENAIDAIGQWRFKPGVKDGQPVTVVATVEVNWRLM